MSRFDSYTQKEYLEKLRIFLGYSRAGFVQARGLIPSGRKGRVGQYDAKAMAELEAEVNQKAARCEAADTTPGERLGLLRDYYGYTDASLGRALGISREYIRRLVLNTPPPRSKDLEALATLTGESLVWLERGGEENLPAYSVLGLRVGEEAKAYREQLFGATVQLYAEMPDATSVSAAQAFIEQAIMGRPLLAKLARRAGGRWQAVGLNGEMLFAPWEPLPEPGLTRRYWTDEVEAIISEELENHDSIYGAWHAMKKRCEARNLDYPQLISLHKRLDRDRKRAELYGVDLNATVAGALALHAPQAIPGR